MANVYVSGETATLVPEEASAPAISWQAVVGGALVAASATVVLMLVGSGIGLSVISPWSGQGASVTAFAVGAGVWLIVVQWLSSALGGYIAGRMRTKWVALHTDEVFFRDTAHGLLSWALSTVIVAAVFTSALGAVANTGVQAASTVASGAAMGAATQVDELGNSNMYFVDSLFRPAAGTQPAASANTADNSARAARILVAGAASGQVPDADKAYLAQLVSQQTGLSQADAEKRVNDVLAAVDTAKTKAKEAADAARKASATTALVGALALVIGAFIAAVSGAIGGRLRDDLPAA